MAAKKASSKKKRELIDTGTDKRYVRRDDEGKFVESDDVVARSAKTKRRKPSIRLRRVKGIVVIKRSD